MEKRTIKRVVYQFEVFGESVEASATTMRFTNKNELSRTKHSQEDFKPEAGMDALSNLGTAIAPFRPTTLLRLKRMHNIRAWL